MPRRCVRFDHLAPDGEVVIIATVCEDRRACSSCGAAATLQCDYPIVPRNRRPGTCNRCLCAKCATEVGDDRHYCPPHERASRLPGVGP
jgi:hypothetical protein